MPDEPKQSRRPDDDDDEAPRPKRRPRPKDDDEEDYDDAPRKRRRDGYGDGVGALIPYKNGKALAAYYCGVFGLISCVLGLGIFGIVPIILGFMGLSYAKKHPEAKGGGHAITGIILGFIQVLTFLTLIGFIVAGVALK
jgi:hypothetical protein